jgi:hypothetical protein
VVLQAVKKSLDSRTKNHQKSLADARKDLQEKLGLMLQVEAQTTKGLIETTRREF